MDTEKLLSVTSLLEICNNLFASVPLLSEDQYQLLFQLDKQLTDAGILTDLSSTALQEHSHPGKLPSTASGYMIPATEVRSDCSHERDDIYPCRPCNDLAAKRERWEALFERYKAKQRELHVQGVSRPASEAGSTSMAQRQTSEHITGSPLLHLQGWEGQLPDHASSTGGALEASLDQSHLPLLSQNLARLCSQETTNRLWTTTSLFSHSGTNDEQGSLTTARFALPNSPAHPQTDTIPQRITLVDDEYRIHWPSISFPLQHNNNQLPHVSYFMENDMQLSKLQPRDMVSNIDHSNLQDISKSIPPYVFLSLK